MKQTIQKYEAQPGETIQYATSEMVLLAMQTNCTVETDFNGIKLTAKAGDSPAAIEQLYHDILDKQRAEYEASPEGIAAKKRQAEILAIADKAASEGILPFAIKAGQQDKWNHAVEINKDPYGACVARYAARWANLMDAQIASGKTVAEIADSCSHEADLEGITGFMYGCAVSILHAVWEHGEDLRRWHNHSTQLRTEGDAANNTPGAVLNPAMLTIK